MPASHDLRQFIAYTDLHTRFTDDPVGHFARLQMTFPKALLGYMDADERTDKLDVRSQLALRESDLPKNYHYAKAAHLCPMDYLTHSLLPAALRQIGLDHDHAGPRRNLYAGFYARQSAFADAGVDRFFAVGRRLAYSCIRARARICGR